MNVMVNMGPAPAFVALGLNGSFRELASTLQRSLSALCGRPCERQRPTITPLRRRAAHRQPADEHRGLADADGHPLPGLAAIAHARIEGHVVAEAPDLLQGRCTVADEGGAFDGRADLAVFDAA